jgi:hypothetical protein
MTAVGKVLWLRYKINDVQCEVRNDGVGTSLVKEAIWDVRSCHQCIKIELVRKITGYYENGWFL